MNDHRVEEPELSPSLLEELLQKSKGFIEGIVADRVKATVARAMDWTFRRVIAYVSAMALFATSAIFLLMAGKEGLRQAGVPAWTAYLVPALLGGFGGLLLLRQPDGKEKK